MDPTVLVTIILALLATGGAGGAARVLLQRLRRRRMGRLLEERQRHREPDGSSVEVSLLDVFWDLGANDFAIEFMRRQQLLPEEADEEEARAGHGSLDHLIEAHGSYGEFVSESRTTIEEFADTEGAPGSRREIHALAVRRRRVLYDDEATDGGVGVALGPKTPGPPDPQRLEDGREHRRLPPPSSDSASSSRSNGAVDLDDIEDLDIGDLFKSATEGRLTDRLQTWWDQRDLRALKSDLDEEFRRLYQLYVDSAERAPDFFDDVYDVADRWMDERRRLEELAESYEERADDADDGSGTYLASSLLAEKAAEAAARIASYVERRTRRTIETIHGHARAGDEAMAGYLVYLNRHAFFAGRDSTYRRRVERIERMAQQLRESMPDR